MNAINRGFVLLGLMLLLPGCTGAPAVSDAEVAKLRGERLLAEPPADAQSVLAVREALADKAEGAEVVLEGVVGGMPNPWPETEPNYPWRTNQASFFVVDTATAAEFAAHAAEAGEDHQDCPFCARRAKDKSTSVASVVFTTADGRPLPVAAERLFNLAPHQKVTLRGAAQLVGGEVLVMNAKEIFVSPPTAIE